MAGTFFVLKYFEYYIVYFMAVNYLKEKKQMERLVWAMLTVCLIVCAIAIYQIPSGIRVSAPFEGETGEPNTLGVIWCSYFLLFWGFYSMIMAQKNKSSFSEGLYFLFS